MEIVEKSKITLRHSIGALQFSCDSIRFVSMGKNKNPFRNLITSIFQGKKKWINKMCWLELIQMHYSSSSLKFHSKKSSNILFIACCLCIHLICLASISMIKNEMQMHFMLRIRANANKMKIHQKKWMFAFHQQKSNLPMKLWLMLWWKMNQIFEREKIQQHLKYLGISFKFL